MKNMSTNVKMAELYCFYYSRDNMRYRTQTCVEH